MRLLPSLLALCLVLATRSETSLTTTLHDIVQRSHAAGDFDGVVIVSKGGKIVYHEAVGLSDRARHTPMRPDTVFRLASETKQVTALLVMQEVVAGRMALDEPASKLLPDLVPSVGRVTVKQLLQHVSGLANPSDGPDNVIPDFYTRKNPAPGDHQKTAHGFCSGPAKRDPGLQFEYNNCDYLVLGALLEKSTGKSYAALVQERVITPLGLRSWGVAPADPARAPRVAIGYSADGSVAAEQNVATYGAAGAIYGNALDLARWDEALLHFTLLPRDATATMFTADPKLYGEALGSWSYPAKTAGGPTQVIERQGDIGGTRLLNNLLPDQGASVIIIANTERADLFNTYSKKGLGYELLKTVASLQ